MQRDGLLARLDLAFSRDQPEKRYVQHLVAEQAGDRPDIPSHACDDGLTCGWHIAC